MAHFAKLDENNIVLEVNVVNNHDIGNTEFPESEAIGIDFLVKWSGGYTNWKQTSYNSNFRKNHAGIGFQYRQDIDAFVPPKRFASWSLNEATAQWEPPIAMPSDGKEYKWNEEAQTWEEVIRGS
jgi:hypothetical protein